MVCKNIYTPYDTLSNNLTFEKQKIKINIGDENVKKRNVFIKN